MGARHHPGLTGAIANLAARLIAEGQCSDPRVACRKAAEQLGASNPRAWPDTAAIEAAVREYQGLFQADRQPAAQARLQRLARDAMRDLAAFRPRLVGAVAKGIADEHSAIQLLLTADTPEQVIMALEDRRIPWRSTEIMLPFSRNRRQARPGFRFQAGETPVELVVLMPADRNDPPWDPATGKPLKGLSVAQLEDLPNSR